MTNKKKPKGPPTYFTPNNGKSITIRYVLFGTQDDPEASQDILNYRTRKFAEASNVEWYSEAGLDDGSQAAIYIYHQDTEVVVSCALDIINYLRRSANVQFLPDQVDIPID